MRGEGESADEQRTDGRAAGIRERALLHRALQL
jgi:hypothetical protein